MAYDLDVVRVFKKEGSTCAHLKVSVRPSAETVLACRVFLRWELGDDSWWAQIESLLESETPVEELAELLGDDFRDAVEGEVLP